MIFNTTKTELNTIQQINGLVGKPFNFIKRWLIHGFNGSKYSIVEMKSGFEDLAVGLEDEDHCSIELRPEGILLHFKRLYESYTWAIPYYHLTIYKSGKVVSIYKNTDYMKIIPHEQDKYSRKVIQTILLEKGLRSNEHDVRSVYDQF